MLSIRNCTVGRPAPVGDSLPGVGTSAGAGDASHWGFLADDLSPRRRGRAHAVEPHSSRFDMGADVHRPFRRPRPEPLRDEVRRRLAADLDCASKSRRAQRPTIISTSFGLTTAVNEITQNGATIVEDRSDIGPNGRPAEQLLRGVRGARRAARHFFTPGPRSRSMCRHRARSRSRSRTSAPRRFRRPALPSRSASSPSSSTTSARTSMPRSRSTPANRFARLEIPAATLAVARSDLAGVASAPADSAQPDGCRRHAFPRPDSISPAR